MPAASAASAITSSRSAIEGANTGLAALIALATLSLVLPTFTTSAPGRRTRSPQLVFAAIASLALWGVFVFVQTVRHRDYFLPPVDSANEDVHAPAAVEPPARWSSFGLLLVSLVAVVGLAKALSPSIERAVAAAGAPQAIIGIAIALLVLLPETWAAIRAARANRIQTSLNLAYGSALASIGLTIPAVAFVGRCGSRFRWSSASRPRTWCCCALTFLVSSITLVSGRTHMMQGAVHS